MEEEIMCPLIMGIPIQTIEERLALFYFSFKKQIYREQTTYQRQIQNQITIFGIKSQLFIQVDFLCQRIRGPPGCFLDNIAALIDETGNPSVCRTGYPTPVLYRP